MRRQTDTQLRQFLSITAAMTSLEAVLAALHLQQVLVLSCVSSFVSATHRDPAGRLFSHVVFCCWVFYLLNKLFDSRMILTFCCPD